ncbi:MAG: DinB family protein [Dehalococcoidia bacterium]
MNADLHAVVEEADANRATFESFCRSLTPAELTTVIPGMTWRVQDYIAHLASIDIYVAGWFEHHASGERFRPANDDGTPFNIDTWNEARIVERRDASVDDLLQEAGKHRERLWTAVESFSEEQLARQFNFRGREISFLRYLQLWTAHDPAHTADMLKGLPASRRGEVSGWLGKYSL